MAETQTQPVIMQSSTAGVGNAVPSQDATHKLAHWIHQNGKQGWLGYTGYQVTRGVASAIPYGASMALTLGGMEGLSRFGHKLATKAPQAMSGKFGARLEQFAKFPAIRSSMMIATSFTLYRGTGKLVKWANDSLFNTKDTEEQTVEKLKHFRGDAWKKIKDNAPAGIASTPVAAFVLGFVNATFTKPAEMLQKNAEGVSLDINRANYLAAKEVGQHKQLLKDVILHPKAKFLEQATIFSLGYAMFFELGDRLFKDKQIARGKWPGDHSSTNPAQHEGKDAAAKGELPPEKKYGFFTNETSIGRFAFRRLVPTAMAIFPYVAFKFRHSYMLLGDLAVDSTLVHGKPKGIWKQMPKLTGIETVAVLWFTMIPFIAEKWDKAYDSFFAKLEKKATGRVDAPVYEAKLIKTDAPKVEEQPEAPLPGQVPLPQVAHIVAQGKTAEAPVKQVVA